MHEKYDTQTLKKIVEIIPQMRVTRGFSGRLIFNSCLVVSNIMSLYKCYVD